MKPRRYRSNETCLGKRRYSDEPSARAFAMRAIEEPKGKPVTELWTYECPHCDGWHLTSKGGPKKRRITAEVVA